MVHTSGSWRLRSPRSLCWLLSLAGVMVAPGVSAEVDWPTSLVLPHHDVSVGLVGGAAFGEGRGRASHGALAGVQGGWHHGVVGVQAALRGQREGEGVRLSGTLEITAWYLALLGVGVRVGSMLDPGGPDVPEHETALTVLVAAPIPLWAGPHGTWILQPFARPGVRLGDPAGISGHHEVGVAVRWTSYSWSSGL